MRNAIISLLLLAAAQAAPQGDRVSTYGKFLAKRQVTKADLIRRASPRLTARQNTISPGFCTIASDCTTTTPTLAKATCQAGLCVYSCPSTSTVNADKNTCECPAPQVFNAASTACVQCSTPANCPAPPENAASVCTTTGTCGFVCNGRFKKVTDSVTKVTTCVTTLTPFVDCPPIAGFFLKSDITNNSKQCAYTQIGDASGLVQYCYYGLNDGVLAAQPVGGPGQPKLVCPDRVAETQENQGLACYTGCPSAPAGYDSRFLPSTSVYRTGGSPQISYRLLSCQYAGYGDAPNCGTGFGRTPCSIPAQNCYYDLVTGKGADYYDPTFGRAPYGRGVSCPSMAVASTRCITNFAVNVSFNPEYAAADSRY